MTRIALAACGVVALSIAGCAGSSGSGSAGATAQAPSPSAAAPATAAPATRNKADEANIQDGVYTAAQATRGAAVFESICSECHEPADWTDSSFLERWNEDSLFRLWYYIFERMPHGDPMTLTREQVTEALTYIFQLNGVPTGSMELGTDDDSLDDHWIIWGGSSR